MALALFDLDDTLIDGDCASLWSSHMAALGWVDGPSFIERDRELMELYAQGKLAMETYMTFSLSPLVGRTIEEVAEAVAPFVEDVITPRIHEEAIACLARHREEGDRLLIISASAHFLVSRIAKHLGVEEVLAIDLEHQQGVYTGNTSGILTYRDGKVTRLLSWLQEQGEGLDGAYFYSDSRNDLPLLSLVAKPHTVNPDAVLRAHADATGWPILRWN